MSGFLGVASDTINRRLFGPSSASTANKQLVVEEEAKDGVDVYTKSVTMEAEDDAISKDNVIDAKQAFERDCQRDQELRDQVKLYQTMSKQYHFGTTNHPFLRTLNDSDGQGLNSIEVLRCPSSGTYFLVSGGNSKLLTVWDFETGLIDCQLEGHRETIWSVASVSIPSSGKVIIASGGADNTVIIWDWEERRIKHRLTYHTDAVWAVAAAISKSFHNQPIILSGGRDRRCIVTCAVDGRVLKVLYDSHGGHTAGIRCIAVADATDKHPNDAVFIVTGGNDSRIVVWNLMTGSVVKTLIGHIWPVLGLACQYVECRHNPIIVSGSVDKSINLWDISTGTIARTIKNDEEQEVGMISAIHVTRPVNGDKPCLISADSNGIVRVYDLRSGELMRRLFARGEITGLTSIQRPEYLAEQIIVCSKKGVDIFDLNAHDVWRNFRTSHNGSLRACALYFERRPTHADCAIFASTGTSGKIVLWGNDGTRLQNLVGGHSDLVETLDFNSPISLEDRILLVSGGWDLKICVWDALDGTLLRSIIGSSERISALSVVTRIGYTSVFSASEGTVYLWNALDGTKLAQKNVSKQRVHCVVAFIPSVKACEASTLWTSESSVCVASCQDSRVYVYDFHTESMQILNSMRTEGSELLNVQASLYVHDADEKGVVYLFGGSHLNVVTVWNLLTGDPLFELLGHTDSIISISFLQNPNFMNGDGVIVTGGADATVRLWSLQRQKLIHTRRNHRHRVLLVVGCNRTASEFPYLCSACEDKLFYEHDLSYGCNMLPPRGQIGRHFESDRVSNDGKWSRIQHLSDVFGSIFWLDNPQLVIFAVWYKEIEFLVKFRDQIRTSLTRTRDHLDGGSFMRYCIHYGSIILIKMVLQVWSDELNKPITDFCHQHYFHLAHQISLDDLIALADKFPTEFSEFICSLRLKPAHKSLYPNVYRINLGYSGLEMATCPPDNYKYLWQHLLAENEADTSSKNKQPITVFFVPLLRITDFRLLHALVRTADALGSVDVFNSEIGEIALRSIWRSVGKRMHVRSFYLYLAFLSLYAFNVYTFDQFVSHNHISFVITLVLHVILILFVVFYMIEEFRQLRGCNKTVVSHFLEDMWNAVDGVSLMAVLIGSLWRLARHQDTTPSRCALAVASILVWFKTLYFARAFASSGPLVSMIIRIAWDIRFFCLVLLLTIIGFSQSFWILSNVDDSATFGTIQNSLLNTFLFMLGGFTTDFGTTVSQSLTTLILVIFLLFMAILMLNLLIALMGESFSAVHANGLGQWRSELASTLIDMSYQMADELKYPPTSCTYVMKYTSSLPMKLILESYGQGTSVEGRHGDRRTNIDISSTDTTSINVLSERLAAVEELLQRLARTAAHSEPMASHTF